MSKEDLIPFNQLTEQEQKRLASLGGKASVKARQEKKLLKEELLILLATDNNLKKISVAVIKKAIEGDIQAFKELRDTIGEKPTNDVDLSDKRDMSAVVELITSIEELKNEDNKEVS
ncbi:MAG: hypothetical protein KAX49_07280 [Halanaerobiales bacterium]|nr:hypothetical protein [Halanaerobiales bacterium]